jgi:hypothetical protein
MCRMSMPDGLTRPMSGEGGAAGPSAPVFQALVESWPGPVALLPPDPAQPAWRNAAFRRIEGPRDISAPGLPPLLGGPEADPEAGRAIAASRAGRRAVATRILLHPAGGDCAWAGLEVVPLGEPGSLWLGLLLAPSDPAVPGAGRGEASMVEDGVVLLDRAAELLGMRRRGGGRSGPDLCLALIAIDLRGPGQKELARCIGEQLRESLRQGDMLGQLPSGYFLLVLPGLRRGQALAVAERLLENVEATEFETGPGLRMTTCSAGLAFAEEGDTVIETVLMRAEAALTRARAEGGGRAAAG